MIAPASSSALRDAPMTASAISAPVQVGRAFHQVWLGGSASARHRFHAAIRELAAQLRANRASPEESVKAFKDAIFRFGGVKVFPGLASDYQTDGPECQQAYAEAFGFFVDTYFARR